MAMTPYHFYDECAKAPRSPLSGQDDCCYNGRVKSDKGFALLIAVIFMSVMLSLGLSLGSLGYKQAVLASSAIESQYAFYAADAALECALYYDQRLNSFAYPPPNPPPTAPAIQCDNTSPVSSPVVYNASYWKIAYRFSLDSGENCADVTVYKYSSPQAGGITTYIFSQGYDVSCATVAAPNGARFSSRGLSFHY